MNDVVTARLALTRAANAAGIAAITNAPGFVADVARTHAWEAAQAAAFQVAKPFVDEIAELCGVPHAPDSDTAKLISELQQTLREVELREYARHGFVIDDSPAPKPDPVLDAETDHLAAMAYGAKPWGSPAPAMPTVAAPPALPDGDDDPGWRPASWFAYKIHARLRMASRPNRLTKRVGKKVVDGAILYSVADARRWWPQDYLEKDGKGRNGT